MAVTANQLIKRQDGCKRSYPVEEAVRLYQGTLVFGNAAGYAVPTTGSGANKFLGVAIAEANNTDGADAAINVEVWADGDIELTGTFTQASVGLDAYATDNYTVTVLPSASGVRIGSVATYVSSTKAIVGLDPEGRSGSGGALTVTADFTITAAQSGTSYDSTGAGAAITGALPAAVPGLEYYFRVGAAQELRVDPNGSETIALPSTGVAGAAGKYLTANAAGETLYIKCVVAGTWNVFGYTGTWTAEA